ncbi:hypothetical protein [Nitrospira sp. Nam74]
MSKTVTVQVDLTPIYDELAQLSARLTTLETTAKPPVPPAPTPAVPLVVPARAQSPHWDHILLSDFGRGHYWTSAPTKTQDRIWLANHIDLVETDGAGKTEYLNELRQTNPTLKAFRYMLDQYEFSQNWGTIPDAYSLHVTDKTTIEVTMKDGGKRTVTLQPGERMQVAAWNDTYHPYNLQDAACRSWNCARLLDALDVDGVFLDAHGPDLKSMFNLDAATKITEGGHIAEYGGRYIADLEVDYQATMLTWLKELAAAAKAKNKFVLLNQAGYTLYPSAWDQAIACNGSGMEFMLRPDAFAWPEQFLDLITLAQQITDAGGVVDAEGNWGYTWIMNRTDWNMWRLAGYYLMKEKVGAPGRVYLNLMLSSNATMDTAADDDEWLLAYQVDVGQPVGDVVKVVDQPKDGNHACRRVVYGREYTKAWMYVRIKDFWDCTTRGDDSLVTVPLPSTLKPLKWDATLGEPVTSIQLRNADSAILMK